MRGQKINRVEDSLTNNLIDASIYSVFKNLIPIINNPFRKCIRKSIGVLLPFFFYDYIYVTMGYLFTIPRTPLSFKRFSSKQRRYYDVVYLTCMAYYVLPPLVLIFYPPYLPSGFSVYIFESVEGIPAIPDK